TLFAARFFSDVAALPGTCCAGRVETRLGTFAAVSLAEGSDALVCVRPQHLRITKRATALTGRVVSTEYRGDCRYVLVAVEGLEAPVALRAPCREFPDPEALSSGALVHLEVDGDDVPVVAPNANEKEPFDAQQANA